MRNPSVLLAELARPRREEERARRVAEERVEHFRQVVHDLAVVEDLSARAEAALQEQPVLQPGVDRDVHAVEVLGLFAVVVRQRDEVARRPRRVGLRPIPVSVYPPPFGNRESAGAVIGTGA